jgi:HEPN domain-containing protein
LKTSENSPQDWLRSGRSRLGSADLLFPLEGASESVIELLQEAAERYLKAFLISRGWKLRRIHDLGALLAEAVAFDARFVVFEDVADRLTDQFWAQHYPGGDLTGVGEDYPSLRRGIGEMVELVEAELGLQNGTEQGHR